MRAHPRVPDDRGETTAADLAVIGLSRTHVAHAQERMIATGRAAHDELTSAIRPPGGVTS